MDTKQPIAVYTSFDELREAISEVLTSFTGNTFGESKLNAATARLLGFDNFKAAEAMLSDKGNSEIARPVYLTNPLFEDLGEMSEELFEKMGLSWRIKDGEFYPLLKEEEALVGEGFIDLDDESADMEFGYSSFYLGQKCTVVSIRVPNKSDDASRKAADEKAEKILNYLRPVIHRIGGDIFRFEDQYEKRKFTIDIHVPFSRVKAIFGTYNNWRDWLERHFHKAAA